MGQHGAALRFETIGRDARWSMVVYFCDCKAPHGKAVNMKFSIAVAFAAIAMLWQLFGVKRHVCSLNRR